MTNVAQHTDFSFVGSLTLSLTCILSDPPLCPLPLQVDPLELVGDSQSQGSATWLVDPVPKDSKRTISTKYETTIF